MLSSLMSRPPLTQTLVPVSGNSRLSPANAPSIVVTAGSTS
jgi:hypothetical protein